MGIDPATIATISAVASAAGGAATLGQAIFGGGTKAPNVPAPPALPAAANPPTLASAGLQAPGAGALSRAQMGLASTILNTGGAMGLGPAQTAQRSLLG